MTRTRQKISSPAKDIKKEPQQDEKEGQIQLSLISLSEQPISWRIIALQSFSHRHESTEFHVRVNSEHLALKASVA